ncbi:MAG: FAD binding domain-containing protein [Acidimicrobiia bacterium]
MKPAPFELHRPDELEEVLALLGELGDDARILAGGQSLVPLLNFRLSRPAHLVDINRIGSLERVEESGGGLALGATARQRQVERNPVSRETCPLLADALPFVGHAQIRNRGTVVGSVAHADPAAEIPAVALALDARIVCRSATGEREIGAAEFFLGVFTTALRADEMVARVVFPALTGATGAAFLELSRRQGDFALVGVGASITLSEENLVSDARLACSGVGPTPMRCPRAEAALRGSSLAGLDEAASLVAEEIDPPDDLHAPAGYRRHVATVLARRALESAAERAAESLVRRRPIS